VTAEFPPNARVAFVASPRTVGERRAGTGERIRRAGGRGARRPRHRMAPRPVVLAAVDGRASIWPVLATAGLVGEVLGLPVRAVHVRAAGRQVPQRLSALGVPLHVLDGQVVHRLVAAGQAADVAVLVIGARDRVDDPRPLGTTASSVATAVDKPVVVVPPDADPGTGLHRVLVPLEGTAATSTASRYLVERSLDAGLDVLALHVLAPDGPPVAAEPPYQGPLWALEFLARYCPWGRNLVDLVTRVGRTEQLVPTVAWESGSDLIVLGWSGDLAPGRARVVRAVLAESPLPVALVPLAATPGVPVPA
jgi:nucleotide-binding universal stress UspA family protein